MHFRLRPHQRIAQLRPARPAAADRRASGVAAGTAWQSCGAVRAKEDRRASGGRRRRPTGTGWPAAAGSPADWRPMGQRWRQVTCCRCQLTYECQRSLPKSQLLVGAYGTELKQSFTKSSNPCHYFLFGSSSYDSWCRGAVGSAIVAFTRHIG